MELPMSERMTKRPEKLIAQHGRAQARRLRIEERAMRNQSQRSNEKVAPYRITSRLMDRTIFTLEPRRPRVCVSTWQMPVKLGTERGWNGQNGGYTGTCVRLDLLHAEDRSIVKVQEAATLLHTVEMCLAIQKYRSRYLERFGIRYIRTLSTRTTP